MLPISNTLIFTSNDLLYTKWFFEFQVLCIHSTPDL